MTLKPNGQKAYAAEQIIEDLVSELTLQFTVYEGQLRLHLWGNIPHGNRDFVFDENGALVGTGTGCGCVPKPSWLKPPPLMSDAEPMDALPAQPSSEESS